MLMMDVDTSCMKSMDLYMMYPHPSWIHRRHTSCNQIHQFRVYIIDECTIFFLLDFATIHIHMKVNWRKLNSYKLSKKETVSLVPWCCLFFLYYCLVVKKYKTRKWIFGCLNPVFQQKNLYRLVNQLDWLFILPPNWKTCFLPARTWNGNFMETLCLIKNTCVRASLFYTNSKELNSSA